MRWGRRARFATEARENEIAEAPAWRAAKRRLSRGRGVTALTHESGVFSSRPSTSAASHLKKARAMSAGWVSGLSLGRVVVSGWKKSRLVESLAFWSPPPMRASYTVWVGVRGRRGGKEGAAGGGGARGKRGVRFATSVSPLNLNLARAWGTNSGRGVRSERRRGGGRSAPGRRPTCRRRTRWPRRGGS